MKKKFQNSLQINSFQSLENAKQYVNTKKEIDILRNITLSYNGFSDYLENFDFLDFYDPAAARQSYCPLY